MSSYRILITVTMLLVMAACSTSDRVPPASYNIKDSNLVSITVYDATKWSKDKPYGELCTGATVNLYHSQDDYDHQKIAYTATTNRNGYVVFIRIPERDYFIEAKLDSLSNMPWHNGNQGFLYDSLYQQYTLHSPINDTMPYGGNFIYRDLNGDNKLDARDYARLPAHKIYAKRKTHTSAIIMIGLKTMSEYQPFANEQAAQDALNDLYTAVHKWHQELAVVDAILSQKASCQYLRYYCQLAQYDLSGYTWATSKTWDAGLLLIQKANRLMKFGPVNPPDSSFYGHVLGIRGYVKMELTDMFGSFPDYNTLQPYKTVYMASAGSVRSKIKEDLNAAFRLLPNLSKAVTDRSRLSKEAINALLVRNALNDKNYAEAAAIAMPIFDDDSAVVLDPTRYSYYTNSASREIIWGYEIASSDLQEIFRKGRYIPVIQLNQLITTHAEAYAQVGKKDEAIALINLIASRSGFTPYPRPWTQSLSETMAKIQLQVFTDQKIEGTSFKSMVRWDMAMTALGPLGFKAHQVLMPIPLSFLNDYPKIMQNPGYQ